MNRKTVRRFILSTEIAADEPPMSLVSVKHTTIYRYRRPVALGEHRMMCRPRDSYDQRLIDARLDVSPRPASIHWIHDVFGNCVAVVHFDAPTAEVSFVATITLDHLPSGMLEFTMYDWARTYPFSYDAEEMPDLLRSIERQCPDPDRQVDGWARQFIKRDRRTSTASLLSSMTGAIHERFTYVSRSERGIQEPRRTLHLRSGSCRDFALLMMEAVRSLGLAARFVSGYVRLSGGPRAGRGGSTHAWLQVYLPGAGWVEFDPTNGIVGSRDLIRVAVARDPRQAVPLWGTWTGLPSDNLGMTVSVEVTSPGQAAESDDLAPLA